MSDEDKWVRISIEGGSWGKGVYAVAMPWGVPHVARGAADPVTEEEAIVEAAGRLAGCLQASRVQATIQVEADRLSTRRGRGSA